MIYIFYSICVIIELFIFLLLIMSIFKIPNNYKKTKLIVKNCNLSESIEEWIEFIFLPLMIFVLIIMMFVIPILTTLVVEHLDKIT